MRPPSISILALSIGALLSLATTSVSAADKAVSIHSKKTTTTDVVQELPPLSAADVKKAIEDYIKEVSTEGVVNLTAMEAGQTKQFRLRFEHVIEPVTIYTPISSYGSAAFNATTVDAQTRKPRAYEIDFWLSPRADGKIAVIPGRTEIRSVNGKKFFNYDKAGNKIPVG